MSVSFHRKQIMGAQFSVNNECAFNALLKTNSLHHYIHINLAHTETEYFHQ